MNGPLPIVPPRQFHEALGSWIERTAAVYDMCGHQLLDYWNVPAPVVGLNIANVDARISRAHPATVAQLLREIRCAPVAEQTAIAQWPTLHASDTPVCPFCLIEDDRASRPRYRRNRWTYAWLTHCREHKTALVQLDDWRTRSLLEWLAPDRHRRTAAGNIVWFGRKPRNKNGAGCIPIRFAVAAVTEIEKAIEAASNGRKPRSDRWGDLQAADFLQIAHEITMLTLTRFTAVPALCTTSLSRYYDNSPIGFFSRKGWHTSQTSSSSNPTMLATVGNVGYRRAALFWTRELMNISTSRQWLTRQERISRRQRIRNLLNQLPLEAQGWLATKSLDWPEEYRNLWWAGTPIADEF